MVELLVSEIADSLRPDDTGVQLLCRFERILFDAPASHELTDDEKAELNSIVYNMHNTKYKQKMLCTQTAAVLLQFLNAIGTRRAKYVFDALNSSQSEHCREICRRAARNKTYSSVVSPLLARLCLRHPAGINDQMNTTVATIMSCFHVDDPIAEINKKINSFPDTVELNCVLYDSGLGSQRGNLMEMALIKGAHRVYKQYLMEGLEPGSDVLRCALLYGTIEEIHITVEKYESLHGIDDLQKILMQCVSELAAMRRNNILSWIMLNFDSHILHYVPKFKDTAINTIFDLGLHTGNIRLMLAGWVNGDRPANIDILRNRLIALDYSALAVYFDVPVPLSLPNTYISPIDCALAYSSESMLIQQPFLSAAESGDIDTVKSMATERNNIFMTDISNRSALYFAAKNGHVDICKFLISVGASPTIRVLKQQLDTVATPFVIACLHGHVECARIIYDACPHLNMLVPDMKKFRRCCPTDIFNVFIK